MTTLSTLSETNKEVIKLVYAILSVMDPDRWKSVNQVYYLSENSWENLVYAYNKRNNSKGVQLPVCSLTRSDITILYDSQGFHPTRIASPPHPTVSGKTLKIRPITVSYEVSVFEYAMEFVEVLFDRFSLFESGKHMSHQYNSSILQFPMAFSYEIFDPKLNTVSVEDKVGGRGYVYEMNFSLKVMTIVGTVLNTSDVITNIIANVATNITLTSDNYNF